MKFLVALMGVALLATAAQAAIPSVGSAYWVDRTEGVPVMRKYSVGTMLREGHNTAICVFDYAKTGGAATDLSLYQTDGKTLCTLPTKAIVRNGVVDIITAPVSAGTSGIALTLQSAGDLKAALASTAYTGRFSTVPVIATLSTAIKLTAARTVTATVSSSALTAGKFRVFLDYVLSE